MDRNLISQRQTDALKIEALRAYFDSRRGRGPAHRRERGERSCEVPVRTVREWFADNHNAELLDEIVPLWPNIGSARQFASEHMQDALQTMVELMRSGKGEKVRMGAAGTLLALGGRGGFRALVPGSRRENTRSSVGGRKTEEQVFVSTVYTLGALVSNSRTPGHRNSRKVSPAN